MTRCTMQCEHKSQCINYTVHTIHHADDDCYFNEYFGGGRDSGGTAWNMERKAVTLVPAAANPAAHEYHLRAGFGPCPTCDDRADRIRALEMELKELEEWCIHSESVYNCKHEKPFYSGKKVDNEIL